MILFRSICFALIVLLAGTKVMAQQQTSDEIASRVDSVMNLMTLEEKIGQLNQVTGNGEVTGPVTLNQDYQELIREGMVGSMLNVNGAEYTRKIQKIAVEETRLGIPLIFGYDVIHGYKTIFPVPLGESASWDMEAIEKASRIAAQEATAAGQHWTFAPMVDISRDARWGRVMEGAGEDPYYGSKVARARIRGFQGDDFSKNNTMLACAKHFVGYGAARGGRDYNTVDMSMRRLHETFLPPFRAAVDEGVATFMSSFNELNGVPVTGSQELVRGIVKEDWDFPGFIVSDWASIQEMLVHGIASDKYEAGRLAMNAGIDMDMEGHVYIHEMKNLLEDGRITREQINDAVRRILTKKFELGLFEDPYRYCDQERENRELLNEEHRAFARKAARKSMVLLKNDDVLPLSKDLDNIALVGPLVKADKEYIGTWSARGEGRHVVNVMEGFRNKLGGDVEITYAKGAAIEGGGTENIAEAVDLASRAEAIVAVVGESAMMSGEALSRMDIGLPGKQKELVMELAKLDKPLVVVLMNGRPLAIPEVDRKAPAILEAWLPGTEGGNAIADIVFGDYNPSGKLTMSFPYSVGQVPVNYEQKNTGRPKVEDQRYTSKYIDGPNKPLYPFGYGLSYTSFEYSKPQLSHEEMNFAQTQTVRVNVKNTGGRAGEEVVQLYVRDMTGSVTRPVKELKGFKKIHLEAGQEKEVAFEIGPEDLAFYTKNMEYKTEAGDFKVFVGSSSEDLQETSFSLIR
jgi:beta-glucosidase